MDPALQRALPGRGINPPLIKIGLNITTFLPGLTTITTMLRLRKALKVPVIARLRLSVTLKIQIGTVTIVPLKILGNHHSQSFLLLHLVLLWQKNTHYKMEVSGVCLLIVSNRLDMNLLSDFFVWKNLMHSPKQINLFYYWNSLLLFNLFKHMG